MSVITKTELRKSINKILKTISQTSRMDQSTAILNVLQEVPEYKKAKSVGVFLPMKNEVETRPILDDCTMHHKTIVVPKIISDTEFEFVMLENSATIDSLPLDKWGIPIPIYDDAHRMLIHPEYTPEVIIVPGVAFDASCQRMGHGKGYYGRNNH